MLYNPLLLQLTFQIVPLLIIKLFFFSCRGDVSGTCLNPARAFGPAVMANYWTYHWVYWVGPIGGSLAAAALLR